MSIEAYKIAVKVSLVENVTRGLQMMARHFKSTDADAKALEARLKSIGKMAAIGGVLMGGGLGGLALLKGPLDEAAKYQTLLERFKQFGMGDAAMKDAEKFVEAQDIMGASQRDMMRYFVEAQGVFRESGAHSVAEQLAAAKAAAPLMAKMNFAMMGLSEDARHATEAKQQDILRFADSMGGVNHPARFAALLDAGFKAVQSSGGNVDFSQFRQFVSKGGTAAYGLSGRSMFADLEPIIGEMKGSTAGTALMTAYNRLNGIVKLPNQVAHELVKNGIWDGSKIVWNSQGGIKAMTGNPLRDQGLYSSDPVEFYRQKMMPMYASQHLNDAQRLRENALIFGRTGGSFFNLIDRQMPTILRSRDAYNKAHGITPEYEAVGKTFQGREGALTAKWQTLMLIIGKDGGILDMATKGLGLLGEGLRKIITFARAHPVLTKLAVAGFALMSVFAIVGGGIALISAGFSGLAVLAPVLSIGIGAASIAFAAIAAAAWLVWNNWKEIWASLKVIFGDIYNGIVKLFHGDILGALGSFGHAFLMSFQVTLNTIIAGVNAINPLFQIPKANFAGDPTQPKTQPPQTAKQPIIIHPTNNVYLDGLRIATVVTKHQAREAARPNAGSTGFDGQRARPSHALGAIR